MRNLEYDGLMVFAGGKEGKYGRGKGEGVPERTLFCICP